MKQFEIEAIFTAKVTEYIQNGYTINPTTMSGHQGEIAKIDLRKGDEIIRVLLTHEHEYGFLDRREYVALTVGRSTEPIRKHQPFDTMCSTIWNNKLDVIEQRKFFQISTRTDYFTEDEEEYAAMVRKQIERYKRNPNRDSKKEFPIAASKIAKSFIKRKAGKSRVGSKEIKVFKTIDRKGNTEYYAEYHGRNYRFA